jgi:hypothetical protein
MQSAGTNKQDKYYSRFCKAMYTSLVLKLELKQDKPKEARKMAQRKALG